MNENLTSHKNEHRPAIRMMAGLNKIRVRSSQQAEGRILYEEVFRKKATRRTSASSWAVCYSFSGIHLIVNGLCPVTTYHTRRFELFWPNKTKNPAQIPRFLPNSEQIKNKNRLTLKSSGPYLRNAPKEICSELFLNNEKPNLYITLIYIRTICLAMVNGFSSLIKPGVPIWPLSLDDSLTSR